MELPQEGAAPLLRSTNPLVRWLWDEGWTVASLPALSRGLGRAMVAAGVPVMRLRLTMRTMHPQLAGLSHSWLRDGDTVEEFWPPLSILREDTFLKSPYALLFQGAEAVRLRLDVAGAILDFPILEELRSQGATDYVVVPMVFADGRINAMTLATDRPGGGPQPATCGAPRADFGIALHLGDVMYGNVGAPGRLDFTVVGPAINEAARLVAMCKTLARLLVISAEFARVLLPQPLVSLGVDALRGVRRHELFTLAEVA